MKLARPMLIPSLLTAILSTGSPLITNSAADNPRETLQLPQPLGDGPTSVEKALHERRSVRHYSDRPIALADVSQLLWAAQGMSGGGGRRTAPSAGALYPLEVYVVAGMVTGLSAGVYSYDPHTHALKRTADGDARAELSRAALGQASIKNAAAVLVISAVYERTTVKYGQRGARYVHMEAGHAGQNIYLEAAALGLGTVAIGAFDDEGVRKVVHLPAREHPLYLMPVGKK